MDSVEKIFQTKVGRRSMDEIKPPFGRASPAASRAAPGEALPNVYFVTGFTCEAGTEAIGGLHINLTSEAVLPNIF